MNAMEQICEFVKEHFEIGDDPDFGLDVNLFDEGFVDSLGATVLAETGTCYLAMTEIRYENAEVPLGDGTTTTLQNQIYGYSLIPKDQFTAQSPALQTVNRM